MWSDWLITSHVISDKKAKLKLIKKRLWARHPRTLLFATYTLALSSLNWFKNINTTVVLVTLFFFFLYFKYTPKRTRWNGKYNEAHEGKLRCDRKGERKTFLATPKITKQWKIFITRSHMWGSHIFLGSQLKQLNPWQQAVAAWKTYMTIWVSHTAKCDVYRVCKLIRREALSLKDFLETFLDHVGKNRCSLRLGT